MEGLGFIGFGFRVVGPKLRTCMYRSSWEEGREMEL
jgi:hypothetical protein